MDWQRLEEIEGRAKAATEGPWERGVEHESMAEVAAGSRIVCVVKKRGMIVLPGVPAEGDANADFIPACRQDVPWLCERLREAKRLLGLVDDFLHFAQDEGPCDMGGWQSEALQAAHRDVVTFLESLPSEEKADA